MPVPAAPTYWTAALVRALPDDGNRYECIDGALLVTPSPTGRHQAMVVELTLRLAPYARTMGAGRVLVAPLDVDFPRGALVQPDLIVRRPLPVPGDHGVAGRDLLLAVEILYPGTAARDRTIKRELYLHTGVPEYWVVDLEARRIERWRNGATAPELLHDRLDWQPAGAVTPLRLDLPALFDAAEP